MRVRIAFQEDERSDVHRKVPVGKQRATPGREQTQTHRGVESNVHLPQARSDWEKVAQIRGAGVLVSVPTCLRPWTTSGCKSPSRCGSVSHKSVTRMSPASITTPSSPSTRASSYFLLHSTVK